MSCAFHHIKPDNEYCASCEKGEHTAFEATRVDWVNRCPQCGGANINLNELAGYKWCGNCGANSLPSLILPSAT
jgi:Zn finger protein HypA/HybF involved in hydrogenase expression